MKYNKGKQLACANDDYDDSEDDFPTGGYPPHDSCKY